ncbi:MAG TPA: tail fiber domain-containing protein [Bradyrhizobium sp.]|nr:tail fiber domain-containing protein [Bradyrhizobium sp.]
MFSSIRSLLAAAALLVLSAPAHAQVPPSPPFLNPPITAGDCLKAGSSFGAISDAGFSCTGSGVLPTLAANSILETNGTPTASWQTKLFGWTPQLGIADNSTTTVGGTNTGFAVGDQLTLNDGCATHGVIIVSIVSGGAIQANGWVISNKGVCAQAPANPAAVGILSSTGGSTNATFNLTYVPVNMGSLSIAGSSSINNGNLLISPTVFKSIGTETTIIAGGFTGQYWSQGNFNTFLGLGVAQSGANCAGSVTAVVFDTDTLGGTDAARNSCGMERVTLWGSGAMKNYTGVETTPGSHMAFGTVAVGANALLNWNGTTFPWNTAVGDSACQGASGATFTNASCFGSNTGKNLTSASNVLILAGGGNGRDTCSSCSGVIDILSGSQASTLSATATNTINFDNSLRITGTNTPSTSVTTAEGSLTVAGGALTATNGSSTVPAITFAAGDSTGLSETSAGTVALLASGVTNASFTSTTTALTMTATSAAQAGTLCGSTSTGGTITIDTTLGCLSSDERLKQIGTPLADPTETLMRLEPIVYRWRPDAPRAKDDPGDHIGLGAFATAYADERLIARGADGQPRAWRQDAMIALLVAVVQRQQSEIEALQKARQ